MKCREAIDVEKMCVWLLYLLFIRSRVLHPGRDVSI